jgi:hypothetical protein
VLPAGLEVPARVTLVTPQTSAAVCVRAEMVGVVELCGTFIVLADVDVHPFVLLVTARE